MICVIYFLAVSRFFIFSFVLFGVASPFLFLWPFVPLIITLTCALDARSSFVFTLTHLDFVLTFLCSMDDLAKGYYGDDKMLAYVLNIQRAEIRNGVSAVKHQHEVCHEREEQPIRIFLTCLNAKVGSLIGDAFKVMARGEERAIKALGAANTMNQF